MHQSTEAFRSLPDQWCVLDMLFHLLPFWSAVLITVVFIFLSLVSFSPQCNFQITGNCENSMHKEPDKYVSYLH